MADPGSIPSGAHGDERPGQPGDEGAPASTGRAVALIAVCAVLGAAFAAVAAGLTWWTEDFADPLTGPVTITASGSSVVPELVPVALVALAGLGAALASHGVLRRIVGAVLVIGGALIAVRCGVALGSVPASLVQDLPRPADSLGDARLSPLGPLLGIAGGLLIAAAGGLIVAGRGARRMSSRYEAPRSVETPERPGRAGTAAALRTAEGEPSSADWWRAMDAGSDPTDAPDAGPDSATGHR